ncbi:hypothetical protein ACIBF5_25315 [Micromonospora sp. NPDC050417]|uniref:hypothetical protein n=1 Tax=Micromonospora sp. NPDC050417 TaxID=3364280 RepID=UPI003797E7D5
MEDPDLPARGLIAELQRIAKRRKRGVIALRSGRQKAAYLVTTLLLAVSGFVALSSDLTANDSPDIPGIVTGAAIGVALFPVVFPRFGAIMYSRSRAELPTWLSRNKDGLGANVIVSAIFLILGVLIGYLLPDS